MLDLASILSLTPPDCTNEGRYAVERMGALEELELHEILFRTVPQAVNSILIVQAQAFYDMLFSDVGSRG